MHGSVWAFTGKLAAAFTGLLLAGMLARLLPPSEMGLYFLSFNLATFFSILGRGGLDNTLLRFIAQAIGLRQWAHLRSILLKGTLLMSAGAAITGFLASLLVPLLGGLVFKSQDLVAVAWFVGGWAALLSVQGIESEVFRGFQEIGRSVWFGGLLTGLITIGLLGVEALFDFHSTLPNVLLIILTALSLNNGLSLYLQRKKMNNLPKTGGIAVRYRELVDHSWPLLINAVTIFIFTQSDLWLLSAYATSRDVAIYGAACRLVMITSMSLTIVNTILPPLMARMHAQNDMVKLEKLMRTLATLSAIPSLAVLAVFMFFAAPIMGLIFGEYYRAGSLVLLILCVGQVVSVLVGSCGYLLIMVGHRKTIMAITLFSAFIAVSLGIYMVRDYGMIGLASAYAVAMLIQQLSMWIAAHWQCGIWTHVTIIPSFRDGMVEVDDY